MTMMIKMSLAMGEADHLRILTILDSKIMMMMEMFIITPNERLSKS
jgi:hypothetical protein